MMKPKMRLKCLKCGQVRVLEKKSPCPHCGGSCFEIKGTVVTKEK